jgi:predicted O-methyltransferase YrrM
MSYQRLTEALLTGQPYFGPALRAFQSPPVRHKYILPVVKAVQKDAGRPVGILEIGSWGGASAISWAGALQKLGLEGHVTCVDPWRPYFDLEKEPSLHYKYMNRAADSGMIYRLFRHNVAASGFANVIRAQVGESRKVLPKLASGSFHVVYLDGSHVVEDVLFDIRQAQRLIRPGGVICGDDLERQAKDLDPAELEAAAASGQDFVFAPGTRERYHPGVTAAVGRAFGEVSAWDGFWAVRLVEGRPEKVDLDLAGAELPAHIAAAVLTVEADTATHYLISNGGSYFALAKELGPPEIVAQFLAEEELPPLVFAGKTLQEIREKVEQHSPGVVPARLAEDAPHGYPAPQLVGSHRDFNLVCFQENVYGLRQSLGAVDVTAGKAAMTARYDAEDIIIGESRDGVNARIDAIEAGREVRALRQEVRALTELRGEVQHVREAIRALSEQVDEIQYGPGDRGTPRVVEFYRGFKLVRYGARIYGIREALGDVDVLLGDTLLEAQYGGEDVILGDSPDGVKARVDALEAERAVKELASRLQSMEGTVTKT